jgi:3-hydroxy-9,10-secoandrosta-1,3,5(10)-triene-9,17-dione monooxygenase reductase component
VAGNYRARAVASFAGWSSEVQIFGAPDTELPPLQSVDLLKFRRVCGSFITGVAVVSCRDRGEPVGLTVNSFTSVSLDPPLVLFCIHRDSQLLAALRPEMAFAVSILADHQRLVGRAFASRETRRFVGIRSHVGVTGAPILSDALAYVEGRILREIDGGDHVIFLGEVLGLDVLAEDMPLAFFRSAHIPVTG